MRVLILLLTLLGVIFTCAGVGFLPSDALASCGSVTCFVVIGSEQQVSPEGVLTVNIHYNYLHQGSLLPGTTGVIPSVDTQGRQLTLGEHRELNTITQGATLDLNYGLTRRVGLEISIPYLSKKHQHFDGVGEAGGGEGELTRFYGSGIGDIRVSTKVNFLPTLRSMFVTGFDLWLPTGNAYQITAAPEGQSTRMEPTMQLGRGQLGMGGTLYQTYELIPHRLVQFASFTYRHTFRNNVGYQFGDEYNLGGGFNVVTFDWLILSTQLNYRYMVHDSFSGSLAVAQQPGSPGFPGSPIVLDPNIANRPVPTTGSTFLGITPGVMVKVGPTTTLYAMPQFPLVRDFNGNLAQGFSFVGGLTQYFATPSLF